MTIKEKLNKIFAAFTEEKIELEEVKIEEKVEEVKVELAEIIEEKVEEKIEEKVEEVKADPMEERIMKLESRIAVMEEALNLLAENGVKMSEEFSKLSEQPAGEVITKKTIEIKKFEVTNKPNLDKILNRLSK